MVRNNMVKWGWYYYTLYTYIDNVSPDKNKKTATFDSGGSYIIYAFSAAAGIFLILADHSDLLADQPVSCAVLIPNYAS